MGTLRLLADTTGCTTSRIVEVVGHKGPHPQRYHERVQERLLEALGSCRKVADCRKALTVELRRLAKDAVTQGTEIHRLLTQGK
ncbi:AHH domain-containing protein [Myxococcus sp. SDU36]|uniref:AHH domain-containing protein n=1 Tax=Myxococcus sp. SDU36 TaxID=2831967 RepID=UPI002543F851|nr:AHH domain-containing protein [Myxococcus sp. SDU36]WIG93053.1 AHH domain-containing protein [Myxococcus sp. SDU36]